MLPVICEFDERFYYIEDLDIYLPRLTWIIQASSPTPVQLLEWIGNKGYEESERIKEAAAERGSRVHAACEALIEGQKLESSIYSKQEKRGIQGFLNFWQEYQPQVIAVEQTVYTTEYGFAGTLDLRCKLNIDNYADEWIIDWKTSKSLYESHKIQISGYAHCTNVKNAMIVQLGNKTKKRYTATLVKDLDKHFETLKLRKQLFDNDHPDLQPSQEKYPLIFSL